MLVNSITLVAYVDCGIEFKERTGGGTNPIRKTKGKDYQKSVRGGMSACMWTRERGSADVSSLAMRA